MKPGPVLSHLGWPLELGPAQDVAPDGAWRSATDQDGIAWLVLDCPDSGTNTVSELVLTGLAERLDALEGATPKAVVIRSAKKSGFAAGADIKEFEDLGREGAEERLRMGHAILDRLAALPCPTLAVVHGAALGGGLEIALACDARIAIDGASFGFPEVRLGLHPGLGGTFRLTQLIDPTEAMQMMLTGSSAHTRKAKKLGLADVVTEERHVRNAVRALADDPPSRSSGLMSSAFRFEQARRLAARRMRSETEKKAPKEHYPAPHALIDLWEEHGADPKAMQQAEIASFADLLRTDTAKNLIRVFFLQQRLKSKARGDSGISHVHVIGAGAMGGDIAAWAALKGARVTLGDVALEPLGKAMKRAEEICKGAHLDSLGTRDALDRLMPDPNGYGVTSADLIIEAAPEKPDLKAKLYDGLKGRMRDGAILATNTSSLRLSGLRDGVPDAARFAGLHFFNPVPKMQLVEVVSHDGTAPDVRDRLLAFCGDIGKLPVPVADYPGFLVNRALTPYLLEAMLLLDEGVEKETIDRAAVRFGMPMGPIALADEVGLDICLDVAESLQRDLDEPIPEVPERARTLVADGHTGEKSGQGFYDWSNGRPDPGDGDVPDGLTDRLILPMLNACVECLRRDVVGDPDDVDGAMIFATGFPPFRGGPMHYARARGVGEVTAALRTLEEQHGPRFRPDAGWSRLA
ncbi:3-hydroxyacyl-CoA dehydrogenase NAD-binding domain-containing protein [Wenxinia marina]|uniref:enoyl-CoA hydratase n=1 Tax=Wenxinia marina DSM 24838 TaxID=1123501 RepID=A0A0D0NNF0_9RHOB|nr:3-hydroxyacyl-CoA dehydrogenase NAD-binding domain-containing protein [Wenxinia marina]KIQ69765.1 3-hydroxyacyl-CoA dehydrogenase [Wenxinia marina DSM 24838]GGL60992.1 fatty-acid oxidation protein subunit alpha [Wenxinia marina]